MHLKSLTLYDEEPSEVLDISFVGELKDLEYLDFQNIKIEVDSHIGIWECVPKLKELYLKNVDGIHNIGDISQLQNLRCLELSGVEDISKSFAENVTSLKNLRTLDFNSDLYSDYCYTNFDILSGFKDMRLLRKIRIWCYTEDKDMFYKVIHKLCEVEWRWGEEILPRWSIALRNNQCILHNV